MRTELNAAGIHDPELRRSYRRCRELNARHGRTFYLATRLLAPEQRPAVHALYGFARRADDFLDDLASPLSVAERAAQLTELGRQLFDDLASGTVTTGDDAVLAATVHTARRYGITADLFDAFLESMRMDITIADYPDRAALNRYMYGSAEVIGLQLLPILGTVAGREETAPYAAALGKAFQLTNFLRDVDEDLARGRVYLPADELAEFGVDRELLMWCHDARRADPRVRRAMAAQHEITRGVYKLAADGVDMLAPRSRPCVAAALTLYSEILDRIEAEDFEVFGRRATVGGGRRLQVFSAGLVRAWRARRAHPLRHDDPAVGAA